nr:hypothetical protein [uncultured Flavobacterium sp.]
MNLYSEVPDSNPFASYKPLTVSDEYVSPWDIADINNIDVGYHFDSNSVNFSWYDWVNSVYVQGLYVRLTPYLGLAYYDGANDGDYFFHNLNNGNYPNLFANGEEYGNYVQGNPIVLASQSLTGVGGWYTHELFIVGEYHCPTINVVPHLNMNIYGLRFDVINNSTVQPASVLTGAAVVPAPPVATIDEEHLLTDYGKVFYYKIEYGTDPYTFYDDVYYALALEAKETDDIMIWPEIFDTTSSLLYDSFSNKVRYNDASKEVVVRFEDFKNQSATLNYIVSDEEFDISDGSKRKVITYGSSSGIDMFLY